MLQQYATKIDRFQDLKRPKIGPCQENDFFAKKTTQDLAGVRLPSVPFPWSPAVYYDRQSLVSRSPLPCEKRSA